MKVILIRIIKERK